MKANHPTLAKTISLVQIDEETLFFLTSQKRHVYLMRHTFSQLQLFTHFLSGGNRPCFLTLPSSVDQVTMSRVGDKHRHKRSVFSL